MASIDNFNCMIYDGCNNLSTLGVRLIHVNKGANEVKQSYYNAYSCPYENV